MNAPYLDLFRMVMPEAIVALAMLAVLIVDLGWLRGCPNIRRRFAAAMISSAGCVAAALCLFISPPHADWMNGVLVVQPMGQALKQVLLMTALASALIAVEMEFTEHVGEFFALLLAATIGLMLMIGTQELLMVYVAMETASLSLYAMAGMGGSDRKSTEAALKYFLNGAMASAFMLFGLSLVYGLTGETHLAEVAAKLRGDMTPLLGLALAMVVMGLGFKVASAPFHFWAPDVYQGAPIPVAALVASGSKIAGFFLLMQLVQIGFAGQVGSGAWRQYSSGWAPVLGVMAVLSMILGNLAAIAQKSVRRLLAYSAVAHAGYILIGIMANNQDGQLAALYYMATYALTAAGAFGVVAIVIHKTGGDGLESFTGLSRRAPLLSGCMLVFMLSLAGIPPLAGFFGKFYLFAAALKADPTRLGMLWIVVLAIAMSAVSLYYYLLVLKQVFSDAPGAGGSRLELLPTTSWLLVFLALAIILAGCLPDLLLAKFGRSM